MNTMSGFKVCWRTELFLGSCSGCSVLSALERFLISAKANNKDYVQRAVSVTANHCFRTNVYIRGDNNYC